MSPCRSIEPLLSERASGPLAAEDEAVVAAHLEGCPSCRTEAARLAEVIELVRAPAALPAEEWGAADLPIRVLAAVRKPARAPGWASASAWRWAVPIAAAAAVALALVAPAALHLFHPARQEQLLAEATPAWEEPDADSLWELAAVVDADADAGSEADVGAYAGVDAESD